MSCRFALLDGAYVLGSLAPGERNAYEAHLPGCASCSAAVRELAGMPGLLARVDATVLGAELPPPPDVLPALLRQVRREGRRRTALSALGAAAAVALASTTAVVAGGGLRGGSPAPAAPTATSAPTAPARPMSPVGQDVVTAAVALVPVAWGTRLDLSCTWADAPVHRGGAGYAAEGSAYALVVRTTSGRTEQVATWRALPGATMRLTGATATAASDIGAVEVRTSTGRVVLRLDAAG